MPDRPSSTAAAGAAAAAAGGARAPGTAGSRGSGAGLWCSNCGVEGASKGKSGASGGQGGADCASACAFAKSTSGAGKARACSKAGRAAPQQAPSGPPKHCVCKMLLQTRSRCIKPDTNGRHTANPLPQQVWWSAGPAVTIALGTRGSRAQSVCGSGRPRRPARVGAPPARRLLPPPLLRWAPARVGAAGARLVCMAGHIGPVNCILNHCRFATTGPTIPCPL